MGGRDGEVVTVPVPLDVPVPVTTPVPLGEGRLDCESEPVGAGVPVPVEGPVRLPVALAVGGPDELVKGVTAAVGDGMPVAAADTDGMMDPLPDAVADPVGVALRLAGDGVGEPVPEADALALGGKPARYAADRSASATARRGRAAGAAAPLAAASHRARTFTPARKAWLAKTPVTLPTKKQLGEADPATTGHTAKV